MKARTYPRREGNEWVDFDGRRVPVVSGGDGPTSLAERRDTYKADKAKHIETARGIAKKAEDENRDFTAEERTALTTAMEAARDADTKAKGIDGDVDMLRDLSLFASDGDPTPLAQRAGDRSRKGRTLGERFVNSTEWQTWLKSVAPDGSIPQNVRLAGSPPVSFGGLREFRALARRAWKDIVSGSEDDKAGALVDTDFRGLLDMGTWQRPLVIADLITSGTTESDTVEFSRVTSVTNAAATVAEATGSSAGDGSGDVVGTKAESSITLERVTETVKTIAHWIPATKRALSDAGQVRTLIDNFLTYGLDEELEDQIVAGDGTGENFTGILETSGTQVQAFNTDLLTTTRKAKTIAKTVGRVRPNAYVFNPEDNETIDLLKTDDGAFHFGGPAAMGVQSLWGVPRIESEAVPAGTGLLADWRFAVLWDREQANIAVSDSHEDFFVRNLIAILAEMRAAFGVIRPAAFVEIDLTS